MTECPRPGLEKRLESQNIFDGRIVHLSLDTVELPNGQQARREIIRHPGAVAIVAVTSAGKLLMVEQYRYAASKIMLEIPAGTLNVGEDPIQCAIRELQEETGFKPGKIEKIGGIYTAPGYTTEFIHLYLASELTESRLEMDEDEFIDVLELSLPDVLAKIASGEIADGKTVCAVLMAKEHLSK